LSLIIFFVKIFKYNFIFNLPKDLHVFLLFIKFNLQWDIVMNVIFHSYKYFCLSRKSHSRNEDALKLLSKSYQVRYESWKNICNLSFSFLYV